MKFILGKKLGMTQIYREDGTVVPVTRIQAGPCVVTQVKTKEKDGINSVQFGYGTQKLFRLTRPEQGHVKGIEHGGAGNTVRHLRELNTRDQATQVKRGDVFTVKIFEPGEKVKVTGTAKGRGFQGVVKRHGFHGSPASHGHKDQLRMPGSIGAGGVQHVFKGTRMAGHMGANQVSVKNLEIVEVRADDNELLVKGAVPGSRNGILFITTKDGDLQIEVVETPVEQTQEELTTESKVEEKMETQGEAVAVQMPETEEAPAAEAATQEESKVVNAEADSTEESKTESESTPEPKEEKTA